MYQPDVTNDTPKTPESDEKHTHLALSEEILESAGNIRLISAVDGKLNPFDEYHVDSKGVFVIIKSTQHFFRYHGQDFSEIKLNYDADVEKLLKTFKLQPTSPNVILGDEITPDFVSSHATASEKKNMFTKFMKRIAKYKGKPSFVFFILLSHGFSDGTFLLSSKQPCNSHTCKGDTHSLLGECVARRGYEDIIKPIQMCETFHGIPKIIFMQTCRGSDSGVVKTRTKAWPGQQLKPHEAPDLFIPQLSDTIVVYASSEQHLSYVAGTGSLLVDSLIHFSDELIKKSESFDSTEMLSVMHKYNLPKEHLVNGWIFDILLSVSARVSKILVTNKRDTNDKQQPVFFSSLRYRLSFLKMLLSER